MVPEGLDLASGPFVPYLTLESVISRHAVFSYVGSEQFWGRAVRAPRDSQESGALLFVSAFMLSSRQHAEFFVFPGS